MWAILFVATSHNAPWLLLTTSCPQNFFTCMASSGHASFNLITYIVAHPSCTTLTAAIISAWWPSLTSAARLCDYDHWEMEKIFPGYVMFFVDAHIVNHSGLTTVSVAWMSTTFPYWLIRCYFGVAVCLIITGSTLKIFPSIIGSVGMELSPVIEVW